MATPRTVSRHSWASTWTSAGSSEARNARACPRNRGRRLPDACAFGGAVSRLRRGPVLAGGSGILEGDVSRPAVFSRAPTDDTVVRCRSRHRVYGGRHPLRHGDRRPVAGTVAPRLAQAGEVRDRSVRRIVGGGAVRVLHRGPDDAARVVFGGSEDGG